MSSSILGEPRRWTLRFPGHPPSSNDRLHWATRARLVRHWKENVLIKARLAEIPALGRVRLSATVFCSRRLVDPDNALALMKPLCDGLVVAGVIPDDGAAFVEWGPVRAAKGLRGIELVVEEVER